MNPEHENVVLVVGLKDDLKPVDPYVLGRAESVNVNPSWGH